MRFAFFLLLALQDSWVNDKNQWTPPEFPISYWVGPPGNFTTLERYKEIAEAGFTIAMPPFDWTGQDDRVKANLQILDFCEKAGLKALLQDKRMWGAVHGKAFKAESVDAAVADYSKHPAFLGFYLRDEPGADLFPRLGQVVDYLREKDPKHPAFINLYPNYASAQQLQTPTYKEHIEKYIQTVRPFVICYDHYHLHKNGDGAQFYSNMEFVRKASLESTIPWWQTVISCGIGDLYRDPTEAEMRYTAMQTLVYGAKGLLWFTYWQHAKGGPEFSPAIIDKDGNRTRHFDEVKRINAKVKAIGKFLLGAKSERVYSKPKDGVPVRATGNLTFGVFKSSDASYVMIANRDYKNLVKSALESERPLLRLSEGKWVRADKTLELAAGDAELFRFE